MAARAGARHLLDNHGWEIEEEFLEPFLFSLKEVSSYDVDREAVSRKLFVCRKTKSYLKGHGKVGALRYIQWGEEEGFHPLACRLGAGRATTAPLPLAAPSPKTEHMG